MAYITKADLITHVYDEIIDVITRANDDITNKAISAGIGEAKAYLNRYDLVAIFGTDAAAPTFTDEFLNNLVKDIIVWRLIILSNPNINVEISRAAYKDACKTLIQANKGIDVDPGWPLRTDSITLPGQFPQGTNGGGEAINGGLDPSGNIGWNSNQRRQNHW